MNVYLVLLHYPVYNKNGEIIATSIVIHDIHDMARCARTYCLKKFFIIQPFEGERKIVERIKKFWDTSGKSYNPNRAEAIEIVEVKKSFAEAVSEMEKTEGRRPLIVGTSAQERGVRKIDYSELAKKAKEEIPIALVFGTGWGIAKELEEKFDYFLPPIKGNCGFNHLSVRSAAAIIMDRLFGR